jgi:hypothetical protein
MNGQFWQLAFVTEPLGGALLKRLGLDNNGRLYSGIGQFTNPYTGSFGSVTAETRTWDTSRADYTTVADAITSSKTVAQLRTALFDNFDMAEVISYIAMARITGQNDDVWANMAIYRDTDGDGLWRVIPYDLNLSFGQYFYENPYFTTVVATDDYAKSHPLYGSTVCQHYNRAYNSLYNAVIQVPETRAMLLRRERELMDQLLQPTATPYADRIIEAKIDEVAARIQQEADLDRAKWGWSPQSGQNSLGSVPFTQAISDIKNLYLDPLRNHFYNDHNINSTWNSQVRGIDNNNIAGIPDSQDPAAIVNITTVDVNPISGNQEEEYIQITNPNAKPSDPTLYSAYAIDISGWTLTGGISFTFPGGTVIPPGESL